MDSTRRSGRLGKGSIPLETSTQKNGLLVQKVRIFVSDTKDGGSIPPQSTRNGEVAQLVRASVSYAEGQRFDSAPRYKKIWWFKIFTVSLYP